MSRKLLAGTVLLGAGILALVFFMPGDVPRRTVSAFLAQRIRNRPVRVEGALVKGSLCKVTRGPDACEYRFRMIDGFSLHPAPGLGPELRVRDPNCLVPTLCATPRNTTSHSRSRASNARPVPISKPRWSSRCAIRPSTFDVRTAARRSRSAPSLRRARNSRAWSDDP